MQPMAGVARRGKRSRGVRCPPPRNVAAQEFAITNSLKSATLWGGVGGGARGGKSSKSLCPAPPARERLPRRGAKRRTCRTGVYCSRVSGRGGRSGHCGHCGHETTSFSYFITDAPSADQFPALGKLVAHLRTRDPAHLAYINNLAHSAALWATTASVYSLVEAVPPRSWVLMPASSVAHAAPMTRSATWSLPR
jgi:hypothetical protein